MLESKVKGLEDQRDDLMEGQDNCCLGCSSWRRTQRGKGECMYFNKDVYTDQSFLCGAFTEGEWKPPENDNEQ